MNAPAVYIGTIAGYDDLPPLDLYNLLAPVGDHPIGSTVSRQTLARFGFTPPTPADAPAARITRRPASSEPHLSSSDSAPSLPRRHYAVW